MFLTIRSFQQNGFTITLLFLGWLVSSMDRMFINIAIVPIGEELHMDAASLGIVLSIFYLGYTLMQIPGGWLADQYGSKIAIVTTILVFSLFAGLSGLAWSVTSLLVIRFIFGLGEGAFPGAATKLMSENVAPEKRTRTQSVLLVAITLGGFVASLGGAYFITQIGWRNTYLSLGILGVILALMCFFFLRSKPAAVPDSTTSEQQTVTLRALLKSTAMWKIMLALFGLYTAMWGLSSWVPSYLMNVRKINLLDAGIYASFPTLAGMIGYLVGGWLVDKIFANREKYVIIFGNFLAALSIYAMFTVESLTLTILAQVVAGFSFQIAYMGILAMPLKQLPSQIMGSAFGMLNTGANLASFLTPAIMGALIQAFHGSYEIAFAYLIVGNLVSLVMGLFLGKTKKLFAATPQS